MAEKDSRRGFDQDFMRSLNADIDGKKKLTTNLNGSVRESDIQRFCGGCDYFIPADNSCVTVDFRDQAKNVFNKVCNDASQNGVDGAIVSGEFIIK